MDEEFSPAAAAARQATVCYRGNAKCNLSANNNNGEERTILLIRIVLIPRIRCAFCLACMMMCYQHLHLHVALEATRGS
jgi:hypothetical protein